MEHGDAIARAEGGYVRYEVKAASVEAVPVSLAGHNLLAVEVEGRAHLVSVEIFELFFAAATSAPKPPPMKRAAPVKAKPVAASGAESRSAASPADRGAELRSIVLKALADVGPLTTAELGDRCYPSSTDAKGRYQGAWCVLKKLAEDRLVEKHEDMKWHLMKK